VAPNAVNVTIGPTTAPIVNGTFKLSLSDQFPCGSGIRCSATASLVVSVTNP